MKISFITLALCLLSSNITLLFLAHLPTLNMQLVLALVSLCLIYLSTKLTAVRAKAVFCLGMVLLSFCYSTLRAEHTLKTRLPAAAEGHYQLIGTIEGIPTNANGYSQAELNVYRLIPLDGKAPHVLPQKLRLTWYHTGNEPKANWHSGEIWQLSVKLKAPRSTYNPASFDQEAWYLAHEIDGVGYVSDPANAQRLQQSTAWRQFINRLRSRLNQAILAGCGHEDGCAQVQALTIGQRDAFSHHDWQLLQATGTNHLFAIAGLHIGMIAGACFWLGKNAWRLLPKCPLWLAAPTFAWFFALIAACTYSALAGFLLPTKRACLTLSFILIARLLNRRLPPWHAWALALTAILLWQPLWILDSSVWLSFGTVALLIYAYAYRWPKPSPGWREFTHLQAVLSLGLWPLTAFFFQNVSTTSFLANLLAIPWVALTVLPLCLLGALLLMINPLLASYCWRMAAVNLHLLKQGLSLLCHLPYSQFAFSLSSPGLVLLSTVGVLLLLAPRALPGRWLGVCYCFAALSWPHPHPKQQAVWVHLLDVGQGLSVFVQTAHHTLVYDTGSRFSEQADMGERVVVPALKASGLKQLDALIISHGDNDHAGGAASVWDSISVLHAYTSDVPKLHMLAPQAPWQACIVGEHWQWDGIKFQFLYPPLEDTRRGNDRSCVLKISTPDQQILLTGDIEKWSEHYLVATHSTALASTILIVPHHGSKTSSTKAFVNAVSPKIALFPLGYHNRFHFPHPSVVARYQAIHTQLYDTATDGQIQVHLNPGTEPSVMATRQDHVPFWRVP